ncbi:MAG: sulfotransferase [Chitinophagaceae bacterium]
MLADTAAVSGRRPRASSRCRSCAARSRCGAVASKKRARSSRAPARGHARLFALLRPRRHLRQARRHRSRDGLARDRAQAQGRRACADRAGSFRRPTRAVLPNAVDRLTEAEYRAWPPLTAPDARDSPIFIVGFPRSGTTLLEQMLDAHPSLQSMDERPFFTILGNKLGDYGVKMPNDIGRLNQRDCDELRKHYYGLVAEKIHRRWDAQLVDKNPLNMLWLPLIKRLYPKRATSSRYDIRATSC